MIHLSERAGHKVREMLQDEEHPEKQYLRVGVTGGGCSGFTYSLGFDENKTEKDMELERHGIRVLVDQDSEKLIRGLEIDYKESMMGGGFTIHNPNAIVTCGCGTSFKTATDEGTPEKC
ncbi:MAG: iron-sulfur cluster assembly accessory protein [Firmicutes bacterium]|uniref:Iron-sulfur cluster assembly protein n=1 Tax=Melghirimyces thermohalophilus TaxID=1236220 RepID=A0A1G6L607_9BACL|nr:iron-sulfur cluster assembly accessory protein [Melghirimyces thermohalophilus]MDA8353728.1 iron-sulfur cluster assembly accessory protein [Bacillota bacterium]SDC38742.1 iron-sulfur cluster assembly protein [Melghirimyces thermohalophilus]